MPQTWPSFVQGGFCGFLPAAPTWGFCLLSPLIGDCQRGSGLGVVEGLPWPWLRLLDRACGCLWDCRLQATSLVRRQVLSGHTSCVWQVWSSQPRGCHFQEFCCRGSFPVCLPVKPRSALSKISILPAVLISLAPICK